MEEAFKSIDFHLIHHLAINRLYEYFFKSAVEIASYNFKDLSEYANVEIWINQIQERFSKL